MISSVSYSGWFLFGFNPKIGTSSEKSHAAHRGSQCLSIAPLCSSLELELPPARSRNEIFECPQPCAQKSLAGLSRISSELSYVLSGNLDSSRVAGYGVCVWKHALDMSRFKG